MIQQIIRLLTVLCWLLPGLLRAQSPPVISSVEGEIIIYPEGASATLLTSTLELASETPVARAIVQITENYVADQDQLLFTDTENIRGVFDEASGTLLLLSYPAGSTATAVNFRNALRSVAYRNTDGVNPQPGLRPVSFQVFNESDQGSNVPVRNVSVIEQNDAPTLELPSSEPINYATNPVTPFAGLAVSDPDNNLIAGAQVRINEGFRIGEDQLALPGNSLTIEIAVSPNNRTITLNGADTPEAYATLLRQVQFINSPPANTASTPGNRSIGVVVNDGSAQSQVTARFVVVGTVGNVPPTIGPVAKNATIGTDLPFALSDFTASYNDPESGNLAGIYIRSKPQFGALFLGTTEIDNGEINSAPGGEGFVVAANEIANLVYRPAADYTGEDRFRWNAFDGANFAANDAPVVITVAPPPLTLTLIAPESATTEEDTEVQLPPIDLSVNQEATVTVTATVANGTLTLPSEVASLLTYTSGDGEADASLVVSGPASAVAYVLSGIRYLPNENYNGTDGLTIGVSAGNNVSDQVALTIEVVPSDDPFRLTNLETDPVLYTENDPPVTLTDQLTIEDLDSKSGLGIASATVTITEGYVPGEDSLRFSPLLNIVGEQQDNVLTLRGINDVGAYQTALRTITYQNTSDAPAPNKTVTFVLQDEADSASNTVARTIAIQAVEDPPQLVGLEDTLNYVVENDFAPITEMLVVRDPDTETLDRVVVSLAEGYDPALDSLYLEEPTDLTVTWDDNQGILTLAGASSPAAYTNALRNVRYRNNSTVRDEVPRTLSIQAFSGDVASEAVSRPIVLIANDPPVVSNFEITTTESSPYVFSSADFLQSYSDPDNSPQADRPAQLRIIALPTNGVVVYRGDTLSPDDVSPGGSVVLPADVEAGLLRYQPAPGFSGTDALEWNAYDGAELAEASATIGVTVREGLTISLPTDSLTQCAGVRDTLAVTLASGQADVTYAWSCVGEDCGFVGPTDQPSVVVAPTQTTSYLILVSSATLDQQVQDTVAVVVEECPEVALDIPTAFTPDTDGQNDTWVIPNAAAFLQLTVEVFDRYGHSVFRSEDYQNDWNGTYEGELLPVGTYYYLVTHAGGSTYKGAVSILR